MTAERSKKFIFSKSRQRLESASFLHQWGALRQLIQEQIGRFNARYRQL